MPGGATIEYSSSLTANVDELPCISVQRIILENKINYCSVRYNSAMKVVTCYVGVRTAHFEILTKLSEETTE